MGCDLHGVYKFRPSGGGWSLVPRTSIWKGGKSITSLDFVGGGGAFPLGVTNIKKNRISVNS